MLHLQRRSKTLVVPIIYIYVYMYIYVYILHLQGRGENFGRSHGRHATEELPSLLQLHDSFKIDSHNVPIRQRHQQHLRYRRGVG